MSKILILGAGAVGGYLGGRLAENGGDITFLVREKREQLLKEKGLRIISAAGNCTLQVKTVTQKTVKPDYDIIIIACKAYDLESSIEAIKPAVSEKTIIIPLLNGMSHIDTLNDVFGKEHVFGGTIVIQATLNSEGVIEHLNNNAVVTIGTQNGEKHPLADSFIKLSDGAVGLTTRYVDQILLAMWEKWIGLSSLAGMTCLMRANIGEIARAPGGYETIVDFITKNIQIAAYYGYKISAEKYLAEGSHYVSPNSMATASMLRDIQNGAPVESEQILGALLKKAKEAAVDHPTLALSYIHLKAYEERRKANRL